MRPDPPEVNMPPEPGVPVYEGLELPRAVPKVPELQFTGPGGGWPPQPRAEHRMRRIEAEPIPGELTDALEQQVRRAALRDERVRALLGERFVHLASDANLCRKGRRSDPQRPPQTRVLFFSHTHNLAVEVLMSGLSAVSAARLPGFQPPEAPEEIEEAVALARADPRLCHAVRDLGAGALLLPFRDGDLGHRHRILWVTFFDAAEIEGEKPALFSAAVDLTDQKVLVARPEPPIVSFDKETGEATNA